MSKKKYETSIISASTILILSAVVLGIGFSQFMGAELLPYLVAVGLSGVLVYLVLDIAASRRDLKILQAEREQVEERLDKHMFSISKAGFTLPPETSSDETLLDDLDITSENLESENQLAPSV